MSRTKSSNLKLSGPGEKQEDESLRRFDMMKPFHTESLSQQEGKGIKPSSKPPTTENSVLSNGLTVASQDTYGQMSSFAFVANVGSAFEVQTPGASNISIGSTQMMELLAFKTTQRRKHQDILEEVEELGGMMQCVSNRDSVLWCIDVLRDNIEPAMDILSDTILNPLLLPEEIEESKQVIELQMMQMSPEILSRDCVQRAAYQKFPLGNDHFCPKEFINDIDRDRIVNFRERYLYGQNCYFSGAGIDHESFVKLAEKYFSGLQRKEGVGNDRQSRDAFNVRSLYVSAMFFQFSVSSPYMIQLLLL